MHCAGLCLLKVTCRFVDGEEELSRWTRRISFKLINGKWQIKYLPWESSMPRIVELTRAASSSIMNSNPSPLTSFTFPSGSETNDSLLVMIIKKEQVSASFALYYKSIETYFWVWNPLQAFISWNFWLDRAPSSSWFSIVDRLICSKTSSFTTYKADRVHDTIIDKRWSWLKRHSRLYAVNTTCTWPQVWMMSSTATLAALQR